MTEGEKPSGADLPEGERPKVWIPTPLFDVPVPYFKDKTRLMGQIEYDLNTPIQPLLKYWRENLGLTNTEIAKSLKISPDTVGTWVKKLHLGPRAKRG